MRNICAGILMLLCATAVTVSAENCSEPNCAAPCFETTCHTDADGTLWCNNQVISHSGSCTACEEPACYGCVNCDYTVPINEGDELVLDEPFRRCGNEPLPSQIYSGNMGGIAGDGDDSEPFRGSYYANHSYWYEMGRYWSEE
jgi:hypothetical protein